MPGFDRITIMAMTGLTHLLVASVLLASRSSDGTRSVTRLWIASQIALGCAFVTYSGRKPGLEFWYTSLPNSLMAIGYGLVAVSFAQLQNRAIRPLLPVIGSIALLQLTARLFGLAEMYRAALALALGAMSILLVTVQLARGRDNGSRLWRFMTLSNLTTVLVVIAGSIATLNTGGDLIQIFEGPVRVAAMLVVFLNAVTTGFGFVLLLNERAYADVIRLSTLDPLTEALNRRSFDDAAAHEIAVVSRTSLRLSVLMCDLDQFKHINDSHGHPCGDLVIQSLVAVCRTSLRASDQIGRWGGEEFAILLPNTSLGSAYTLAWRLNRRFAAQIVKYGSHSVKATVSIGVAEYRHGEAFKETLNRADEALYRAKALGRNRVETEKAAELHAEAPRPEDHSSRGAPAVAAIIGQPQQV